MPLNLPNQFRDRVAEKRANLCMETVERPVRHSPFEIAFSTYAHKKHTETDLIRLLSIRPSVGN
jgi:hypothetical protein